MGFRVQRSVSRPLRSRLLFWDFGALGFGTLVWGFAAELVGALQGCGGRGGLGFMILGLVFRVAGLPDLRGWRGLYHSAHVCPKSSSPQPEA